MTATSNDCTGNGVLYMAIECGWTTLKLAFGVTLDRKPRIRTIQARDLAGLLTEIGRARDRFKLPADVCVVGCYEAGRDGFWLHRALTSAGVDNLVVDSSSIQVSRRKRSVKTDRVDAGKLLNMLIRHTRGERGVWSVVRVPGQEAEDDRQLHRELDTLKKDRKRHISRIKSYLATEGLEAKLDADFETRLSTLRRWDGSGLPRELQDRLRRELGRLQLVETQLKEVERERQRQLRESERPSMEKARRLMLLKGIGINAATLFGVELFGWREFRNRRQLGALVGLTPTLEQSGERSREHAISKAGNHRVRAMLTEIAWCWLRWQPGSELSQWFLRRYADGSTRMRKIGIVALARKLLIHLWRFLETGVVPPGAVLKTT